MELFLAGEAVRERLDALSSTLGALAGSINELCAWPALIARHEHGEPIVAAKGGAAIRLAATAFRGLDFHNEQDERRVVRYVGAVAVTAAAIREAEIVNEHKGALVDAIGAYRRLASKRERDSHQVRDLLIRLGYARLNLVQTYRKIPILQRAPTRIGFTWIMGTKHVETVDREEAMRRISGNLGKSEAKLSRARRAVAEAQHEGLRLVRPVAPHVRANIVWYENDERRTACVHAPLPILYRYSSRAPEPEIVGQDRPEPDPRSMPARQRRSDSNLRRIAGTIDVFQTS